MGPNLFIPKLIWLLHLPWLCQFSNLASWLTHIAISKINFGSHFYQFQLEFKLSGIAILVCWDDIARWQGRVGQPSADLIRSEVSQPSIRNNPICEILNSVRPRRCWLAKEFQSQICEIDSINYPRRRPQPWNKCYTQSDTSFAQARHIWRRKSGSTPPQPHPANIFTVKQSCSEEI